MARKRRPREHIIHALGVNYVERLFLLCGHTPEPIRNDYGYDLIVYTFDENGEFEIGEIKVQVKSTDNPSILRDGAVIAIRIDLRDLHTWLRDPSPVLLILYDASADRCHWMWIQEELKDRRRDIFQSSSDSITVHFSVNDILDERAVSEIVGRKRSHMADLKGEFDEDE